MLSANIDPLFRGNFLAAISPANEVSVEEANIQTLGLGAGLGLKAGRFLSGIGYANEQHPHAWDFSDAALPYQAFFGPQLGYDGVQFKWLAPTDLYLELGAEAGRARGFPANDEARNKNGLLSGSVFAHVGGDVGFANSWRAGLSVTGTRPRERGYEDVDGSGALVSNSFTGTSATTVADFVWKWAPGGNASERSFTFQSEWMRRHESGELTYDHRSGKPRHRDRHLPRHPDRLVCAGRVQVRAALALRLPLRRTVRWRAGGRPDRQRRCWPPTCPCCRPTSHAATRRCSTGRRQSIHASACSSRMTRPVPATVTTRSGCTTS